MEGVRKGYPPSFLFLLYNKIMKKNILIILLIVSIVSCSISKKNEEENTIEKFKKDSVMQSIMYSNLDTVDGHWRINISKNEAFEIGVDAEIYALFEKSIKEVNTHIDSMKKNSNTHIGYNFPNLSIQIKEK